MKILDKITLVLFSVIILIIAIIIDLLIFRFISFYEISMIYNSLLENNIAMNSVLAVSIICELLALKAIFFGGSSNKNNIDGVLLENESGKLLISKDTIENLVNGVAKGFENTQSVSSRVAVGNDNGLYITVTLMVLPNTVINELSMNLQTRIKEVVKKVTDLEVKSIDVRIRNITTPETKTEN